MLHFYPSNHSENLASVIAHIMAEKPLQNPFDHETILIQSQGMGTWLKQQLSEQLGIAAMIKTQMPASFIWQLSERLLPNEKLVPRFEKRNLRWELMRVLPGKLNETCYQSLAQYLNAQKQSNGADPQLHLFQICDRLADLYDAYQNYRSDWITAWESGKSLFSDVNHDATIKELERWQADLWRSVYPNLDPKTRLHRPDVLGRLLQEFKLLSPASKTLLPKRLFIFGLSALPPQWLPLFEALSRVIDVHFLAFNPCQQYWGDIQTRNQQLALQKRLIEQGVPQDIAAESIYESNPLLASWGKLGRDYVSLISASNEINEISVDLFEAPQGRYNALKAVQADILNLESQQHVINDTDNSIRFAVCHSRLREVEALHDYLLDLLDAHPELEARDIIVMMPDVESFTPFIEAVFSRPAHDVSDQAQYLAYGISDQLFSVDQPLVDIVLDTLNLSSKRITSKDVLAWLELPAIRSRFNIEDGELQLIQVWIDELNVRWGISEAHRDGFLDTSGEIKSGPANTWLSAFKRLLAGCIYAEQAPLEDEVGQVLPFRIDGRDQYALVGKLIRFVDVILHSLTNLSGRKRPDEWLRWVNSMWQGWFDETVLPDELIRMMDGAIEHLQEQFQFTEFDELIEFDVVASALQSEFQNERVSQRFLAGRINFCTLMPMRSIPFKVVCLLGMNEGEYPRLDIKTSFDLMSSSPGRLGDRSPRNDDRYLFLEAICSAREFLYVSYCGFDLKDNSERFPSVLVSEFRDYCQAVLVTETAQQDTLDVLTCVHRLQPFHPDYYRETSTVPKSYCADWLALHHSEKEMPHEALSRPEAELDSVHLDDFTACMNHPLRFYYQNSLGVSLGHELIEQKESEPFALDGLDTYKFKHDLVTAWENDQCSDQDVFDIWRLSDRLPRPPVDTLYWESISESMSEFKLRVSDVLPIDVLAFEESVENVTVFGEFHVNAKGLVMLSLSKRVSGQFFGFWARHVLWNTVRHRSESYSHLAGDSILLTPDERYVLKALDEVQAEDYLAQLMRWYRSALTSPTMFLAKTAFAALFGGETEIKKAFHGSHFNGQNFGEAYDPYWLRACHLGSTPYDSTSIPVFTGQCLYDQVQHHLELGRIDVSRDGES